MAIQGWIEGQSVEIGAELPKLDWIGQGIYRKEKDAKNLPPILMGSDYLFPNPLIHDPVTIISMAVAREESKAREYMEELESLGVGIGPSGMGVIEWADQLSRAWYGLPYESLHKAGRPDLAADFKKRGQIRAAMATMSWPAWMAMNAAQVQDVRHLSNIGGTVGSIATSTSSAIATVLAVLLGPVGAAIGGLITLGIGAVNTVLMLAAADTQKRILKNIQGSGLRVLTSDRAAACAVVTMGWDLQRRAARAPGGVDQAVVDAAMGLQLQLQKSPPAAVRALLGDCPAAHDIPALAAIFDAPAIEQEAERQEAEQWAEEQVHKASLKTAVAAGAAAFLTILGFGLAALSRRR